MKQAVTIKDIAKKLGISKSTVSRALSGDCYNVKKETLDKILETAKILGYKRNSVATNLRLNRTRIIGIVVPELVTSFYVNFITRVQSIVYAKGYQVSLSICNEDPDIERKNLQIMMDNQVEGILISACHNTKNIDVYKQLMEQGIPLIFFDRTIDDLSTPKVKIDDYIKSFFLVEYLIRTGRKKIVHLAGPSFIQNTHERIRAYKDAMDKFNLPYEPEFIIDSGVNFEDGEKSMEDFMKKQISFDAIFCFTEMSALGAKSFLQKLRYSIPEDVAICCVSGTILSTLVHPTLTVVEQPIEQMAEKSIELLFEKLSNPDTPDKEIILESKMIIRESTE
ncbi:MAG: LacI family DNA-binding transcriptional regulator [Bacteroides sp.]|nr:LacI family DNA-binding transcriptional regulator [Bacteroides sp.]